MPKDQLQFQYSVHVDDDKIADGIALAKEMMQDAMKNLAFYADGCTGCLLAMFGAVADMTVENARAEWDQKGVSSFTCLFENVTKDERQRRMKRHLAHMKPHTRALLLEAQKRGANVHAGDDDATH